MVVRHLSFVPFDIFRLLRLINCTIVICFRRGSVFQLCDRWSISCEMFCLPIRSERTGTFLNMRALRSAISVGLIFGFEENEPPDLYVRLKFQSFKIIAMALSK